MLPPGDAVLQRVARAMASHAQQRGWRSVARTAAGLSNARRRAHCSSSVAGGGIDPLVLATLRGLSSRGLPCFAVPAESVSLLSSPKSFFSEVLGGAVRARHRVHLASLYVGTGERSATLLRTLAAPEHRGRDTHLLFDYHRAHRTGQDGRAPVHALAEVVASGPRRRVSLYRHAAGPHAGLEGWLPRELFEIYGVQHGKACVFDDDVLITGANLSDDYFRWRHTPATRSPYGHCIAATSPLHYGVAAGTI